MASEADVSASPLLQRLVAMSFLSGFTTTRLGSDPEHPDNESTDRPVDDRIVLINPMTQGMVVIGRSSEGFESLLNDLMAKDGQRPASQASIGEMPSLEIKGKEEIESLGLGDECVICLEEWGVGDVAKEMPCKHRFHGECVEKWLKINGSCPVCRHTMPVDDSDKKSGDESRRRVREVWVTFSFGNGRSSSEEDRSSSPSNEEQSVE